MKIFSALYDKVMTWSEHRHAVRYLSGMSFIESIFWPIPVDVMLAPMALSRPNKAWHFAMLATIFSVLGAMLGYALGQFFYEPVVEPLINSFGYQHKMEVAFEWFERWGVLVVFVASFTPIPYKVFTLTAGILNMAFIPFVLISLVGRGLRFYLVAGLMKWGGAKMEAQLRKYVEILGWLVIVLAVVAYLLLR
ncbi:YqaA family protein [Agarivorans sp. MS3-6]|uniref:YqaA family protein n=1 Tax=Agarivorans sp. TSD2052 TaxID=2937286 RepID=UPI00200C3DE1|nr:YqaA family protein [Agarivorans sp. TSD2052]UPW17412.1 DedA family protein [Agarivorans sp. TSD2052]